MKSFLIAVALALSTGSSVAADSCRISKKVICIQSVYNEPVLVIFPVGHELQARVMPSGEVKVVSVRQRQIDVAEELMQKLVQGQSLDPDCDVMDDPHRICVMAGDSAREAMVQFGTDTSYQVLTVLLGRVPAAVFVPESDDDAPLAMR